RLDHALRRTSGRATRPASSTPFGGPQGRATPLDQKVNVVGHDHVGPDLKVELGTRRLERLTKPFTRALAAKEWHPAIAGEGQLTWLTGLVVAAAALLEIALATDRIDDSHANKVASRGSVHHTLPASTTPFGGPQGVPPDPPRPRPSGDL